MGSFVCILAPFLIIFTAPTITAQTKQRRRQGNLSAAVIQSLARQVDGGALPESRILCTPGTE